MSFRVDRIPDLGLHGFLRYALPGYAFWTILLVPAILNYGTFREHIPIFSDYFGPVIVVLSGPVLGFVFFHIYYVLFECLYLRTAFWPQVMRTHFELRPRPFSENEYRLRALYDLIYFDEENRWKDRIDYLFSSFHSLATCSAAMWFALAFWICYNWIGINIAHTLRLGGCASVVIITYIFIYHYVDRYRLARPMEKMVILSNLARIRRYIGLLDQ